MVDLLFGKVVSWLDYGVSFVQRYSSIIIWGVVAMMVAKLAKFKINIGK